MSLMTQSPLTIHRQLQVSVHELYRAVDGGRGATDTAQCRTPAVSCLQRLEEGAAPKSENERPCEAEAGR